MTIIERPNHFDACATCRLCSTQIVTHSGKPHVRGIYISCSIEGRGVYMQTTVESNADDNPQVREIKEVARSYGQQVNEAVTSDRSPRMDVSKTCPGKNPQ